MGMHLQDRGMHLSFDVMQLAQKVSDTFSHCLRGIFKALADGIAEALEEMGPCSS